MSSRNQYIEVQDICSFCLFHRTTDKFWNKKKTGNVRAFEKKKKGILSEQKVTFWQKVCSTRQACLRL